MKELLLFTDGSVNTRSGIGYGAYLAVMDRSLSVVAHGANVTVRRFEHTSSTKLELQTLLWAIAEVRDLASKVIVRTDSQNILGLPGRRERLEQNEFRSKAGRLLNNYELYREFYYVVDQVECEFVKVCGHRASQFKDDMDDLFTLVDRASRNALRDA